VTDLKQIFVRRQFKFDRADAEGEKWCQQWLASCRLSHPFGTRKNGRSSPSSARKNGHVLSGAE
jgi:hypothetical protein